MATGYSHIAGPPDYDEAKFTWKNYRMEVEMWSELTKLVPEKKGPALWISLTGKAKEIIQDMPMDTVKAADGLDKMIDELDKVFKIDDNQAAYLAYQEFENFRRPSDMSMQDFVVKFESLNSSIKRHQMTLPDGVLAYRFLHSANLQPGEVNLCRATINEFKYDEMKKKVLSLFADKIHGIKSNIKEEQVFYGSQSNQYSGFSKGAQSNLNSGNSNYRGSIYRGYSGRGGRGRSARGRGNQNTAPQNRNSSGKMNPADRFGNISTCSCCGSKFHWIRECPDKSDNWRKNPKSVHYCETGDDNYEEDEVNIELLQKSEDSMKWFVGETMGCGVIDSGCSKTVAGRQWLDCYLEQLGSNIDIHKSKNVFRFGKGSPVTSQGKCKLPAKIGSKSVTIETDIVDMNIPLLLSKESLKTAGTILDFTNDQAMMFGEKQTLIATESGHYAIPLNTTMDHMKTNDQITLMSNTCCGDAFDPKKAAEKLHRQFGHCSAGRLTKLVQMSKLWNAENEKRLTEEISSFTQGCNVCKQFKKAPPTPIVSLPLANEFNDVVAMDLIVLTHGQYILHLIDLFTRYSVACVRNSKRQDRIVDAVMKTWVSYFGSPKQFLADNGGEFSNTE